VTQIQIENGQVVNQLDQNQADTCETIELPEPLTLAVARAMFDTPIDHPCGLPNLILRTSPEDRVRFEKFCRENGLEGEWACAAVRWVGLLNHDNSWHLEEFNIVHRARVGSWWVDEVAMTDTGHQFVTLDERVYTPAEFEFVFGTSLTAHLVEFANFQKSQLEQLVRALSDGLVIRKACVQDSEGKLAEVQLTGPRQIPAEEWELPPGVSLVDPGEQVDTIENLYQECHSA
jgi:hypothetical protein